VHASILSSPDFKYDDHGFAGSCQLAVTWSTCGPPQARPVKPRIVAPGRCARIMR
jgi:hypothetical protein